MREQTDWGQTVVPNEEHDETMERNDHEPTVSLPPPSEECNGD